MKSQTRNNSNLKQCIQADSLIPQTCQTTQIHQIFQIHQTTQIYQTTQIRQSTNDYK